MATTRARAKGKQGPEVGPVTHEMVIPDELLAWGRQPSVAVHHAVPWAREIEHLLNHPEAVREEGLSLEASTKLVSLLEGLTAEAVAAKRADLLVGFDIVTAELLRLVFVVTRANGTKVEVGRSSEWSYDEMRHVLATSDPPSALRAAAKVKAALAEVFPDARIGEIFDADAKPQCATCDTSDASVMLGIHGRFDLCYRCWSDKVYGRTPSADELKARDKFIKQQLAHQKLEQQLDFERKSNGHRGR